MFPFFYDNDNDTYDYEGKDSKEKVEKSCLCGVFICQFLLDQ